MGARAAERLSKQTRRHDLFAMVIAAPENQLAKLRPFARAQFKSACGQRISPAVVFEFQTREAEGRENIFADVGDCRSSIELSPQELVKNLKMTRTISERRAGRRNERQLNRHCVTIPNRIAVQMRRRFDSVRLI